MFPDPFNFVRMEIPHTITVYLKSVGLNMAERLDVPNRELYSLYKVDKNNQLIPTGLPHIVEISDGKLITLPTKEAFELIIKDEQV